MGYVHCVDGAMGSMAAAMAADVGMLVACCLLDVNGEVEVECVRFHFRSEALDCINQAILGNGVEEHRCLHVG